MMKQKFSYLEQLAALSYSVNRMNTPAGRMEFNASRSRASRDSR